MTEYSEKMDEVIALDMSIEDTLVAMLEEASKYDIEDNYDKCSNTNLHNRKKQK